jgi:hypothetical protein
VLVTQPTTIRLGHYSLPELEGKTLGIERCAHTPNVTIIGNGEYKLATIPLYGWNNTSVYFPTGLHPMSDKCGFIMSEKAVEGEHIMVTLHLWKKGNKPFSKKEINPVKSVKVAEDLSSVEVIFTDKTIKQVKF